MKGLLALVSVLLLLALLVRVANAQQPVGDDQVNAIAKQLYCPVCENTPLDVCPTQACKDWRELIRQQLSEGWEEAEIVDYFVANYGTRVLAQPPARGFTALVWVLPVIGLAGGGVFLWRLLHRWQGRQVPAEAPVASWVSDPCDISPDVLARIEREVEVRF
jgi:cytochrome c-type biogenesis protein CcmH